MKRYSLITKLNIFIFILAICMLGIKMYYADKVSTAGREYQKNYEMLLSINKENELLMNKVLVTRSLNTLHQKAMENGYVNTELDYFTDLGLASR